MLRGIERGEFRAVNMDYAVYTVLAPMMFLMLWKHSIGACVPAALAFDPEAYISSQVDNLLYGLLVRPSPPPSPPPV